MSHYFSNFSNNLPSYPNLNAVCALDTTGFVSGTSVIVPGQGFFTWYLTKNEIPKNLLSNDQFYGNLYPTTYGYAWIQTYLGVLVNDDGTIDVSNLPILANSWMGPEATKYISGVPAAVDVIPFNFVNQGDAVFLSPLGSPSIRGVPTAPLNIQVNTNSVTIKWNGTPTGPTNYNLVAFPHD